MTDCLRFPFSCRTSAEDMLVAQASSAHVVRAASWPIKGAVGWRGALEANYELIKSIQRVQWPRMRSLTTPTNERSSSCFRSSFAAPLTPEGRVPLESKATRVSPFAGSRRQSSSFPEYLACKTVRRIAVRGMGGESGLDASAAREPPTQSLGPAPSGKKVRVALCQLAVSNEKNANIGHARAVIEKAADEGAQLVVLPEMWNCPYSNASFPVYAEVIDGDSPSSSMLSAVAREKGVTIVGGSIPERVGDKLYNTCLVYDKNGELKAKHRKVHLFDIDIPGKITFKESETLTPGDSLTVVDTDVGRIGVGICYDIRFPELAMLYAAKGVHVICYPGAFNMTTGPLHWELLSRARAVDNQLYVITCSPARDTSASYHAWGHSTVVGPFGEVIATTEHSETTVFADLDYSVIEDRRSNMPLQHQRRGDLYTLVNRTA